MLVPVVYPFCMEPIDLLLDLCDGAHLPGQILKERLAVCAARLDLREPPLPLILVPCVPCLLRCTRHSAGHRAGQQLLVDLLGRRTVRDVLEQILVDNSEDVADVVVRQAVLEASLGLEVPGRDRKGWASPLPVEGGCRLYLRLSARAR